MLTVTRCATLLGFIAFSSLGASCSSNDGIATPDAGNPENDASTPVPDTGSSTPDSNLTGVERFRQICMSEATPITHVRELTMAAAPRLAGSVGNDKAVAWALEHMKAIGLQNVHTEPVTVPHWERGTEHAELLGATETPLAVAALGGSVSTPPGGLEGEVVMVSSVSALSALSNAEVQGKIVFIDQITERSKSISGYSAAVGARQSGASTAAGKGAIASIVRSITPAMDNFPHTGQMSSASIPGAAVSAQGALALERAVSAGPTRVRLTLESTKFDNAQSANVIGEVPGRDRPDEIVLIGGHLDAWDLATGALDDGAGVAMALESARLLATEVPEGMVRTTRVILWQNEEFGTSGANAYATAHQAELAKHVIANEADLGGDVVYGVTYQAGAAGAAVLPDLLAPLMPLGIAAATSGGSSGTDLGPLRRAGVPVAELQQDMTTYFDYHHAGNDRIDAVDPDKLRQATCAMAVFAYQVGRSTADLGRAGAVLASENDEH